LKLAATLACSNMQSVLLGTPPLKLYYIKILHKIEHVKETGEENHSANEHVFSKIRGTTGYPTE
jgi:hypothetical protein